MKIPSLILKQLYTFGSLENVAGGGVQFGLKNRLSDASLTRLKHVKIGGEVAGGGRRSFERGEKDGRLLARLDLDVLSVHGVLGTPHGQQGIAARRYGPSCRSGEAGRGADVFPVFLADGVEEGRLGGAGRCFLPDAEAEQIAPEDHGFARLGVAQDDPAAEGRGSDSNRGRRVQHDRIEFDILRRAGARVRCDGEALFGRAPACRHGPRAVVTGR